MKNPVPQSTAPHSPENEIRFMVIRKSQHTVPCFHVINMITQALQLLTKQMSLKGQR